MIFISSVTSAITVGGKIPSISSPPDMTLAPSFLADSTQFLALFLDSSSMSGPINVSSS